MNVLTLFLPNGKEKSCVDLFDRDCLLPSCNFMLRRNSINMIGHSIYYSRKFIKFVMPAKLKVHKMLTQKNIIFSNVIKNAFLNINIDIVLRFSLYA